MLEEKKGVSFITFDIFKTIPAVTAAVSTRCGGRSQGVFSALNMSFASGEQPDTIRANRRAYLQALHIDAAQIVCCNQVHGIHVEAVGKDACGRGALTRDTAIADCDGLITNESQVPLTMNFADCTPLLLVDPVHHAIAVSHGGWRGTAGNIGKVTLQKMADTYGTQAGDVLAAIGPAIGGCCFEVGPEVIEQFRSLFTAQDLKELARYIKETGKYYFDLPKANEKLLLQAGILPKHLENAHICTYCRDDLFYSYRKASKQGQKTGRHMAVVMWRD